MDALFEIKNSETDKDQGSKQAPRESETKFKSLLKKIPCGVIVHNSKTEIITSNEYAHNFLGLTENELLGKTTLDKAWYFLNSNETIMDIKEYPVNRVIETGVPVKNYVVGVSRPKTKDIVWGLVNADPEFDENNKIVQILVTFLDITDQKKAEEATLEEAIATKDKFFSIIAHDLKNPFNIILGFSDLLLQNHKEYDIETRENVIKTIYDISLKTFNLLENLLAWSRSKSGNIPYNPKILDIKLIANDSISLFNEAAEKKNIKLILNSPEDYSIFADRDMMAAVIRNLVNNAIKFTSKNGEIVVSINKPKGTFIEIRIKDSGIGIRRDKLNILFSIDRDWNTPGTEDEAGTGLGLFLCKEFVEKNGGVISVESEVGVGTEFIFTVPSPVE